jgi:hypothetical protein
MVPFWHQHVNSIGRMFRKIGALQDKNSLPGVIAFESALIGFLAGDDPV